MFNFDDRDIDKLIHEKKDFHVMVLNKYKVDFSWYIKENESPNLFIKLYKRESLLKDYAFGESLITSQEYSFFKERLITNVWSAFIDRMIEEENPNTLLEKYLSFLQRKAIFNSSKFMIKSFNNVVIISNEYTTERELFFIKLNDKDFIHKKKFFYKDDVEYDLYNPYPFILQNQLFMEKNDELYQPIMNEILYHL